jgi:hypothetical protein
LADNEYHFVTHWRFQTTVEEMFDILGDGRELTRWWPSVYLDVKEIGEGDHKVISLYTKGWLPYTLRWQFRVTEWKPPRTFTLQAWGDFVGRGIWTFEQDGEWANITYDWKIRADKPLLRYFSFIMKPLFSANHHWAMQMGEESLKLELMRRRAKTDEDRARIPAPPPPTFKMFVGGEAAGELMDQ